MFEAWTGRPVYPTSFREYLSNTADTHFLWPLSGSLSGYHFDHLLARGGITAITAVGYRDVNGTNQTTTGYTTDLFASPARLTITASLTLSQAPNALWVDYVAGWTAGTIPEAVRQAVKLAAYHLYEHRSAYDETDFSEMPMGFRSVCDMFRSGWTGGRHG